MYEDIMNFLNEILILKNGYNVGYLFLIYSELQAVGTW